MKSDRFLIKAIPELLIASTPAFFIIINDLINVMGIKDIGTGILWGFPSQFLFMGTVLLVSLIVSAVRDQEGWIKHKWPIHCALISLIFPLIAVMWIPFSFDMTKRASDSAPFWDFVGYFLIASVLLPSSLLLGFCVRFVLFPRPTAGKKTPQVTSLEKRKAG